ncbi:MAG: peptide deformylase [Verrucomicrobiales bacterium]|jgi:peptide deformylase
MVRPIVIYGDPVLRAKCVKVEEVTPEIRELAADMIETMIEARGVGLAAPQVGEAIQLAVIDVSHDPECISYLRVNGKDTDMKEIMPLIFINPQLELITPKETEEEGCLSFPDIRAMITRPEQVKATLMTLNGEMLVIETDGLFSRAIQHETDHLHGRLFLDRMPSATKVSLKRKIKRMMAEYGHG